MTLGELRPWIPGESVIEGKGGLLSGAAANARDADTGRTGFRAMAGILSALEEKTKRPAYGKDRAGAWSGRAAHPDAMKILEEARAAGTPGAGTRCLRARLCPLFITRIA